MPCVHHILHDTQRRECFFLLQKPAAVSRGQSGKGWPLHTPLRPLGCHCPCHSIVVLCPSWISQHFPKRSSGGEDITRWAPRQVKGDLELHNHLLHYTSLRFLRFWGGWWKRENWQDKEKSSFSFHREKNSKSLEKAGLCQSVHWLSLVWKKELATWSPTCTKEGGISHLTCRPQCSNEPLMLLLINYPY